MGIWYKVWCFPQAFQNCAISLLNNNGAVIYPKTLHLHATLLKLWKVFYVALVFSFLQFFIPLFPFNYSCWLFNVSKFYKTPHVRGVTLYSRFIHQNASCLKLECLSNFRFWYIRVFSSFLCNLEFLFLDNNFIFFSFVDVKFRIWFHGLDVDRRNNLFYNTNIKHTKQKFIKLYHTAGKTPREWDGRHFLEYYC